MGPLSGFDNICSEILNFGYPCKWWVSYHCFIHLLHDMFYKIYFSDLRVNMTYSQKYQGSFGPLDISVLFSTWILVEISSMPFWAEQSWSRGQ